MILKIDKSKIPLISPNINNVISDFYDEKIGNIDKIIYELKNYTGENYVVTGYRGSGKTTFVKFLESKVIDNKNLFVFVDYPISKGYYTLLKQIIRNLYISVKKSTLIGEIKKTELLNEMDELYRSTFTEIVKDDNKINLNRISQINRKEISIIDLILYLIGIFGILLYFVSSLIPIDTDIFFVIILIDILFIFTKEIGKFIKFKKEKIDEKIGENKSSINIKSYYDDDISENHLKDLLQIFNKKTLNITFVIDELDKIENEQDIDDIINSVKPLLLSGLANFIIVSGQTILHQIYKGLIESDKVINSLFSINIHVPLLPNSYFHEIVNKIIYLDKNPSLDKEKLKIFVDNLILLSRKNLRNFIINLKKEINWDENNNSYINFGDLKISKNNSHILNIIEDIEVKHLQYNSPGIRDYLIELLYIWNNKIFIKNSVKFKKEDIITYSNTDYISQFRDIILIIGDIFLKELVNENILIKNEDTYELNNEVYEKPNNNDVQTVENIFLDYFITFEKMSKEILLYFGIEGKWDSSIILFLKDSFKLEIDADIFSIRDAIAHGKNIEEDILAKINFHVRDFPTIILTIIERYTLDLLEKYFFDKGFIGTNLNSDFLNHADIYSDTKMFDFVFLKDKIKINIDVKYNNFSINNYVNYKECLKENDIYIIIFYYDYKKINGFQKIQDLNKILEKNLIKNIFLINNSESRWIVNSSITKTNLDEIINNLQENGRLLSIEDNIFTTGISSIDRNIKIFSKELILVASHPIELSTNFLLNIYINKFLHNEKGLFISNNIVKEKMIQKILSIILGKTGIDAMVLLGEIKKTEFHDLYKKLINKILYNINYKEIETYINESISFVMIDNIQTCCNTEKEYNEFIRLLKEVAVKYNITIFVSSNLPINKITNRLGHTPIITDLSGYSESLVNLTNSVITLYKEDFYDEFTERKGIIDVFLNNSERSKIELFDNNGKIIEVEKS